MTRIHVLPLGLLMTVGCANNGGRADQGDAPGTRPSPATAVPAVSTTARPAHAECLVCKKNVDLACIDVDVANDTPTYLYQGRAYYFCSDECRRDFEKNPQKYLKK